MKSLKSFVMYSVKHNFNPFEQHHELWSLIMNFPRFRLIGLHSNSTTPLRQSFMQQENDYQNLYSLLRSYLHRKECVPPRIVDVRSRFV